MGSEMCIRDRISENFSEASLQPASYDIRLGDRALLSRGEQEIDFSKEGVKQLKIGPGDFALVLSKEKFKMPLNMVGHIGGKSQLGRRGLTLQAGLQIDPGFDGYLVMGLYNASPKNLYLEHEQPFATVDFYKLSTPVEEGFVAQGDLQEALRVGRIPRIDKDYLRELETMSLSEIQSDLRKLTQNVTALTRDLKIVVALVIATFVTAFGFGLAALLVR